MRSSERARRATFAALGALLALGWGRSARAQQAVEGFAVDRLYTSPAGGGWFVMDALDMHGGLGGAAGLTVGYAHDPLRVATTDGSQRLAVVSDESLASFGFAATYDRFRLSLDLAMPLDVNGNSGTIGRYAFTEPSSGLPFTPGGVNPGTVSDAFADARVGFDARILGDAHDPFRLGASAQLYIPSPNTPRSEYITDGSFRAMFRALVAGDVGPWSYAGQLGVHVRPLDDAPAPGSPQGSELLFGAAVGRRFLVDHGGGVALVVGPEVYGETAFASFFGTTTTGVEGLVTGRVEGTAQDGGQLRVKLGVGGGLDEHFGAPEWRAVLGVEVFDRSADADRDGVTDSKDACPNVPGARTTDPKTNGCPADRDADGTPDATDACPDTHGVASADPKANGCPLVEARPSE